MLLINKKLHFEKLILFSGEKNILWRDDGAWSKTHGLKNWI